MFGRGIKKITGFILTFILLTGLFGAAVPGTYVTVSAAAGDDMLIARPTGPRGYRFIMPILHPPVEPGSIAIGSRADLEKIGNDAEYPLNGKYHLTGDIDLSGADWVPIGGEANSFSGIFDGRGYAIRNLSVTGGVSNTYIGLFGYIGANGMVKNLGLEGTVINVSSPSNVYAGGVSGYNHGTINNCYNAGVVSVSSSFFASYAGGIGGSNRGTVINCYNTGEVAAFGYTAAYAGGIFACNNSGGIIKYSYNLGHINADANSFAQAGGINGQNLDTVEYCYNLSDVSVRSSDDFASWSGGISGEHSGGTINNCYNMGKISIQNFGGSRAGGISGASGIRSITSRIYNCYNTGNLDAVSAFSSSLIGGICGDGDYSNAIILNSYWNVDSEQYKNGVFLSREEKKGVGFGSAAATSLTTAQMTNTSMYTDIYFGFNFNTVWGMASGVNNNYPYLRMENTAEPPNISITPRSHIFPPAEEGYGIQPQRIFTITNHGSRSVNMPEDFDVGDLFEISQPISLSTLPPGRTATFAVRPKTGLAGGNTYEGEFEFTIDGVVVTDIFLSFTVERAPANVYINPNSQTFPAAAFGYTQPAAQVFTLTNAGNQTVTGLRAFLEGESLFDFEISAALSSASIQAGGTAAVSVRPKTGLAAGTYTAYLVILGDNYISLTVPLSFTVNPPSVSSVTVSPSGITLSPGGTRQFTASVTGTGSPSQSVIWSVSGGISSTTISTNGLLTVSPSETAPSITVTAKSAVDPTKTGTATVYISQSNVSGQLNSLLERIKKGEAGAEDILDFADKTNTRDIAEAMKNTSTLNTVRELETVYASHMAQSGVSFKITVDSDTAGNFFTNQSTIRQTGSILNARPEQAAKDVVLHFSKPAQPIQIDGTKYQTAGAVPLYIDLEGITNSSLLNFPVHMTLPIPAGLSANDFWIIHRYKNGTIEEFQPVINNNGTFSFITAAFSTFSLVNRLASVTAVTVSPSGITLYPGNTGQFTATVSGTGSPSQTVIWSVSGGSSTISANGLLSVSSNETASSLTVSARSTADSTKTGAATVYISQSGSSSGSASYIDASISPSSASYDKSAGGGLTIRLYPESYSFVSLRDGSGTLYRNSDYTISGTAYTLTPSYLSSLSAGTHTLTFTMNGGYNPRLSLTVRESSYNPPPSSGPSLGSGSGSSKTYSPPAAANPEAVAEYPPLMETPPAPVRSTNINGRNINLPQPPVMLGGNTLIPVRGIFESMGFTVVWNASKKTATLTKGNVTLVITEGSNYFTVNGTAYWMRAPAQAVNGHLMAPFVEILNSIGCTAYRDGNNNIHIYY